MDSLAQAYRWSYDEIMRLTYPQILLLNHAADVNKKRLDARIKSRRRDGTASIAEELSDMPVYKGRKLTDLTSEELASYMGPDGPRPKVIKRKRPPTP